MTFSRLQLFIAIWEQNQLWNIDRPYLPDTTVSVISWVEFTSSAPHMGLGCCSSLHWQRGLQSILHSASKGLAEIKEGLQSWGSWEFVCLGLSKPSPSAVLKTWAGFREEEMEAQRGYATASRLCRKSVVEPRIGLRCSASAPQPQDLCFLFTLSGTGDVTATVASEKSVALS